jgi:hypothetical protein
VTTLDDLLDHAEEEPEHERAAGRGPDTLWWWLAKATLWSVVLALPVWAFFRLGGLDVPYALLAMVLFVGRILRALLRWIDPRRLPRTLVRPSAELVSEDLAEAGDRDGLVAATARWDTRLSWVRLQGDKGQFARTIQPRLIEIIDDRLRLGHGVIRSADPAGARAVLGEPLWQFMTAPVPKNLTPRELAGLISLMEGI